MAGEVAKQIFERARLPNEVLGRVWNLADSKQRGVLDGTEFIIAMHLLTAYKTGAMKGLPQTLPPGLYDAAARRTGQRTSTPEVPPVPAIPKQFSGPGLQRTQSPLGKTQTGGDWLITPQEKSYFDTVFATVDKAQLGAITGEQAVTFFSNAQLPEETLAQIWDLADIDSDGQLNKDEFAVAMYLIRQQRNTKDPLPPTLAPALVPPSMRRQAAPLPRQIQPQSTGQARSAAEDLFGLDVFNSPAQIPQSTGGSNPQSLPPSQPPASPTTRPTPPATFQPFVPTSSFGQSLNPQVTGSQSPAHNNQMPQSADDLLGDADPEESKKLTQDTSDLANLSNQVGTLSKEMQSIQTQRGTAEQDLAQVNQQKRDFETRLAQARAMYEQEVKDFKSLEDRLKASRDETRKLQQDIAMLAGTREDLQSKHNQMSAALEADKQENANLKESIKQTNSQISQLKPLLEKLRSEARQQKGLVAINKKQLATVEGEREKTQGEIDSTNKEIEEVQRQAAQSPQSVQSPGSVPTSAAPFESPAMSTASQGTNPFFRRATNTSENALSPQSTGQQRSPGDPQSVFDNVFGTSFSAPSASTPPPTTFRAASPQANAAAQQQQPGKQTDASNTSTPSTSPPPASSDNQSTFSEPPPPPLSRQITANNLPIPGHQMSETSSIMPSPPASRFGVSTSTETDVPSTVTGGSRKESAADGSSSTPVSDTTEKTTENDKSPSEQQQGSRAQSPAVPGAFPGASDQGTPKKEVSFDEVFGGPAHERSQSQRALDFEEAFASMKVKQPGGKGDSKNGEQGGEFPPIREFDDDDDSSTDSEGPVGFDDDFAPASPTKNAGEESKSGQQPSTFPSIDAKNGSSSQLPTPNAQQSPPTYDAGVPKDVPGHSPAEFKGLLPDRADPTAAGDAPHSVESTTKDPIVGGVPQHDAAAANKEPSSVTAGGNKKPANNDFDAAFAGLDLAPAKEADDDDDSGDDDDFESPFNRDATNFDISFDSPSNPSKSNNVAGSNGNANANNAANSNFFDFDANTNSGAAQATSPQQGGASPPTGSSHDWDALFSALDTPKDGISTDPKSPVAQLPPSSTEPSQASVAATSFPQPPPRSKSPGWALNAESGEDDLILQRLTTMGYARDESLAALEKFDYNLDKVRNTQSY